MYPTTFYFILFFCNNHIEEFFVVAVALLRFALYSQVFTQTINFKTSQKISTNNYFLCVLPSLASLTRPLGCHGPVPRCPSTFQASFLRLWAEKKGSKINKQTVKTPLFGLFLPSKLPRWAWFIKDCLNMPEILTPRLIWNSRDNICHPLCYPLFSVESWSFLGGRSAHCIPEFCLRDGGCEEVLRGWVKVSGDTVEEGCSCLGCSGLLYGMIVESLVVTVGDILHFLWRFLRISGGVLEGGDGSGVVLRIDES